MTLNVAGCNKESIVDGTGIRYTIFVQGCPHNCPGCHNPETHKFGIGTDLDFEQIYKDISCNVLLDGVTYSGGEPMCFAEKLIELSKYLKDKMGSEFTFWCYTGYVYEEIIKDPKRLELLGYLDVLVDGPYIQEKRDLTLSFRGSSNQRIIDVKKSLATGRVVEMEL